MGGERKRGEILEYCVWFDERRGGILMNGDCKLYFPPL